MPGLRFDSTPPGSYVVMQVDGGEPEIALFLGVQTQVGGKEGRENREAIFVQADESSGDGKTMSSYTWRAYRFQGRWVVGSSARVLRLLDVLAP